MAATMITPELQTALVKLVRQELEQQLTMRRENRSTYQEICKDFQGEMERYNKYTWHSGTSPEGKSFAIDLENGKYSVRIRDGIGALLRAMYHVDYVVRLPASAEPEMRAFFREVLDLMEKYRPQDTVSVEDN